VRYPGFEDYPSLTRYVRAGRTYEPDPENHRIYSEYQKIYDELYEQTKESAHRLSELASLQN